MKVRGAVAVVLMGAGIWACGTEDGAPADVLLAAPPEGAGLQLAMNETLAPGEEATYCQAFVMPDDGRYEVAKFEHRYSEGSHHMLVFRTDLTADEATDMMQPYDCETINFTFPVAYAAQSAEGEQAFPDGVALFFEPGEVLLVQSHYLNATTEQLDTEVRVNLWKSASPAEIEAGTLFFYDWAIVVPPGESTARMHCIIPEDITLVFAMSHMHRRGVGYDSWLVDADAPRPEGSLYATTAWEEVQPTQYEPGVEVRAGQAIDYECRYRNEEGRTIIEGPSAVDNEMCMFVGTYYPKLTPDVESCLSPGSGPQFEGTSTCSEAIACAQGATSELEGEECLVDTCAASSAALSGFGGCMFANCVDQCGVNGSGTDECQSCIAYFCVAEYVACSEATCD